MTNVEAHRTHIRMGSTTYDVEVEALELDEAEHAEHAGRVAVNVVAAGEQAEVIAEGTMEVDIAAAGTLGTVLAKALRSVADIAAQQGGGSAAAAANWGQPWTDAMDAELERQWLAGATVAEIADLFGRSPGSIRARLPRVGCDPVNPGAYLPEPPSRRAS
ncbi:MAG: helix-turn-helix domain containing protein [Actinophytocola sp.]|nr:helix-turn-helix domain containing protein [Actinophytocola sp.]